jgi:hypothetical protein
VRNQRSAADETVRFAIGGTAHQINLSTKNATAFRRKPAPFNPSWLNLAISSGDGRAA